MNKFKFINSLLENEKFNSVQKDKFLRLVFHELSLQGEVQDEIFADLKRIKEKLKIDNEDGLGISSFAESRLLQIVANNKKKANKDVVDDSDIRGKQTKRIIPNPKHVAEFMNLFNQRDGLKYLTHDYDENSVFDIDEFLLSAYEVFKQKTNELKIPQSLWIIVKQFAFGNEQTDWSSITEDYEKFLPRKIGWSTKELQDWSRQNGLHPIRNEDYKKVINDFKRITRIESHDLEKLIDSVLRSTFKEELGNFDIKKVELHKADFYSHVLFLKNALETIFEEIKKRSQFSNERKISIKYARSISDDEYFLRNIIITHHNSFPIKELDLIVKEWGEKGNMGKIRRHLLGYCHWSVETIIDNSPTRVNIIKEEGSPQYEKIKNTPDGFTHIITFYYR